jgi:hypothetical protein
MTEFAICSRQVIERTLCVKKFLVGFCSVLNAVIEVVVLAALGLFLFALPPVVFERAMQAIIGIGLVYFLFSRVVFDLRRRGESSTRCQFVARISLRRRKPRVAAGNGLYCPGCGRRETVVIAASAFVVQGPKVGKDYYAFEGDADHYECEHCEAQFVNWSSVWPQLSNISTLLALIGHRGSDPVRWTVNVISVGEAIALLGVCEEELIERAVAENTAVLASRTGPVGPVGLFDKTSGDLVQFSFRGESAHEALADLRAKMPPASRERLVGIPASAWMSLPFQSITWRFPD